MAGYTPVDVVNLALLQLSDRKIVSFSDGSELSDNAALVYPEARDIILEAHPWNFATFYGVCQVLTDAPAWGWTYQYSLPTDPYCLKVLQLQYNDPFEIGADAAEGRVLLTDASPANIRYVGRVDNLQRWNTLAREALVVCLGRMLAAAITGQVTRRDGMVQEMTQWIQVAQMRDAQEGTPHVVPPNTTLTSLRHRQSSRFIAGNPTWS